MSAIAEEIEMTREEKQITEILTEASGRERAVSVAAISRSTGINERRVRQIVKHLIERHQFPIGSTTTVPSGYYIITDNEERIMVRKSLLRRAFSILKRASVYDKAGWVGAITGQLELELEKEGLNSGRHI